MQDNTNVDTHARGTRAKRTLYCFAAIFQKAIPLKTKCCLSAASFILFRNRRWKIAKPYSVLTFFASFFVSRQKMKRRFYQEKRGIKSIFVLWYLKIFDIYALCGNKINREPVCGRMRERQTHTMPYPREVPDQRHQGYQPQRGRRLGAL